jgi:hypothetical protein
MTEFIRRISYIPRLQCCIDILIFRCPLTFALFVFLFAGAKVSDTIRKGIIDLTPYENNTALLMVGNVAALAGTFTCFVYYMYVW